RVVNSGGWPPIAFIDEAPMQARNNSGHFLRADQSGPLRFVPGRHVSKNYFDVIRVPLVAGRMPDNDNELVINRTGASLLWPDSSALGRTVISGLSSQESESKLVVGIAPDLPSGDFTKIEPVAYTLTSEFASLAIVHSRDPRVGERFNN